MAGQIDVAEAERLKTLGNDLYQRGEYDAARHKYTEAIKKNPDNAILYANRAAVHIATKEYLEAAVDCRKATELDPTFAKAWGRLGTATHELSDWHRCVNAWKKALDCLPKENLAPMQKKLKSQFTEGLNKAMVARRKIDTSIITVDRSNEDTPWRRAEALLPARQAARKLSCVFIVALAYAALKAGMEKMDKLEVVRTDSQGNQMHRGMNGAFADLTNCIFTDARAFHLEDPNSFLEKLDIQSELEDQSYRGFLHATSLSDIKEQIVKRLRSESWDRVRPAIATTVRTWLFHAFFRHRMLGHLTHAFEVLTKTIELLEWGRKKWPNVPDSARGVVFKKSFIRAVKCFQLRLMHESVARNRADSPYTFADLIATATELLEEVDSDPPPQAGMLLGDILAYWNYVKGDALSILGWSHFEPGLHARYEDGDTEKGINLIQTASEYYLSAAKCYPEDEPYHADFLRKHLECLCHMDQPLRVTLPVCERIRAVIPQALEVFATAPFDAHLRENLSEVAQFEAHGKEGVMEGRLTLDSVEKISIPRTGKLKTEKDNLPFKVVYPGDEGYGQSVEV